MAIRFDKKLNNEINKTVRNFNQKISRLEKEERELILPEKITKKELKSYKNRQELQKRLKELKQFSKRGAEQQIQLSSGEIISRYELDLIKKDIRNVKTRLTKDIRKFEETEIKVGGIGQNVTLAQIGDRAYLNLKARREALDKDISKLGKDEFKRYKKLLGKSKKSTNYYDNIFKENYIKILFTNAYMYGYDTNKLVEVEKKLMAMSGKDFTNLFNTDKLIQAIIDYYPAKVQGIRNFADFYENVDDINSLYDSLVENIDNIIESS